MMRLEAGVFHEELSIDFAGPEVLMSRFAVEDQARGRNLRVTAFQEHIDSVAEAPLRAVPDSGGPRTDPSSLELGRAPGSITHAGRIVP